MTVDLPTPPLPLVTAMTRVSESAVNGLVAVRFPPRRRSVSAARCSSVMTPTSTCTLRMPGTPAAASATSRSMRFAMGHPAIVSRIPTVAKPSSTSTSRIISSSPRGRRSSGSVTAPTASRTASATVSVASGMGGHSGVAGDAQHVFADVQLHALTTDRLVRRRSRRPRWRARRSSRRRRCRARRAGRR